MAKKKPAAGVSKPFLALLALCDGAGRDPTSKKTTLYGIFDTIFVEKVPADAFFTIYAKVTGGKGKYKVQLSLQNQRGKEALDNAPSVEVDLTPGKNAELVIRTAVKFKTTGMYSVAVLVDGRQLGHRCPLKVVGKLES